MKKLLLRHLPLIIIAVLCLWAGKGLFKYSVFSTHDGNHHLARAYDAIATAAEGHFPLRWAGTLNYLCGVPIFNFFYPLYYYLVIIVSKIQPDVITNLKLIDLGTFLVGTYFFYFWIKNETKNKWVALSSSLLYLFAPYRFLLVFVRGSPEFIAYATLPMVLYFYSRAFEAKSTKSYVIFAFLSAIAGGLLTISHNFTVMFLLPIVLLYLIAKVFISDGEYSRTKVFTILFSFISAFGFGAFFIFPAIFEEKFTQLGTPKFLYSDHFPALWQLVHMKWDYFYSAIGTELDGMSFELGIAQWVVLLVVALWLLNKVRVFVLKRKIEDGFWMNHIRLLMFFTLAVTFIFLMLPNSNFIWQRIRILQDIQFPWRLLGIAVFSLAALFPFFMMKLKSRPIFYFLLIVIPLIAIVGNRNHLLPQPVLFEDIHLYNDFDKYHYHRHTTTTFGDDIIARDAVGACWDGMPLVASDREETKYEVVAHGSTYGMVKFNIPEPHYGSKLVLGLGHFPGAYSVQLNGKETDYQSCEGRVCLAIQDAQPGANLLTWHIIQTPIQRTFNLVTLVFLVIWIIILATVLLPKSIRGKKIFLVGLLVFAVFAYLRFYNLDKRVGFGWDEERDAWAITSIFQGDLKFIGPRVLGPEGFFLPPYFFYILAPFYKMAGGSGFATVNFLVFYNVLFFISAFFILKKVFSDKLALLFLFFYGIMRMGVLMDTIAWNPLLIPLSFMLLLYLLVRYRDTQSSGFLFIIGILFGFGVSFHFQFLLLLPILIPFVGTVRKSLIVLVGLALPFIPLLIFDLKNNFLNTKLFLNLLGNSGVKEFYPLTLVWGNVTGSILGIPYRPEYGMLFFAAMVFLLFMARKYATPALTKIWTGFLWVWITFPVFFFIYGKRPSEYYFNYLFLIVLITFAFWFLRLITTVSLKYKLLLVVLAIVFSWNSFNVARTELRTNAIGLFYKDKVSSFISVITKDNPRYNVSFSVSANEDSGYRYLMDYRGVIPQGDSKDPFIKVNFPPVQNPNFIFGGLGVIIPQSWLASNWVKGSVY